MSLHLLNAHRAMRLTGVAILAALALGATSAYAQQTSWKPEKKVEIIVGVAPGGAMDRTARLSEESLKAGRFIPSDSIVLNRAGGGHAVALAYLAQKRGDPHYVQMVNTLLLTNNLMGRSQIRHSDYTPIATLFEEPMAFAVRTGSDIKDANDLLARLKKDPGSVTFSVSSGIGTANHVAVIKLGKAAGVDIRKLKTISFNSSSEGTAAALGGHIDVTVTPPAPLLQFVEAKQLRFVAFATDERVPGVFADVPTWKELGVDATVSAWRAVIAPPGLKPEHIRFWEDAFATMIASDGFKAEAEKEFLTAKYLNSAQTGAFLQEQEDTYRDYLNAIGTKP